MQQMDDLTEHIFISPHFDDVCFSLGCYLASHQNSRLINVFTRCNFIANPELQKDLGRGVELINAVSQLRNLEDEGFSRAHSLERINLNLSEATVIGRHPFELSDIEKEIEEVGNALMRALTAVTLSCSSRKLALYCPIGIGGHRNHLSVLLAILKHHSQLRKRFAIFFYEDLPYAAKDEIRKKGIAQFKMFFKDASFKKREYQLSNLEIEKKLEDLNFYLSQKVPQNGSDFINVHNEKTLAFESLWEVCLKD
jgi:hypothetical protein